MSELWIPQAEKLPDVKNLYDMVLVFQEELDNQLTRETQFTFAMMAVESLKISLEMLKREEREITLATRLALIQSVDEDHTVIVAKDIGIQGSISSIQCVELEDYVAMSLSLEIDAMSVFPLYNPENGDYLMSTARTPMNKVNYIETIYA